MRHRRSGPQRDSGLTLCQTEARHDINTPRTEERIGLDGNLGKLLIVAGLGLALLGVVVSVGGRLDLGRLPGDIILKNGNSTVYFPVVTCLVISFVFSVLMWLLRRLQG